MNKLNQSICLLMLLFPLLVSCKKDEESRNEPAVTVETHLPLNVGNYWIYRQFKIDTAGVVTATNTLDSCYIASDTLINNLKYYRLVKPLYYKTETIFLRDSLHYLVNEKGRIFFSSEDFTNILATDYMTTYPQDTILKVTTKMTDKDKAVSTEAGNFITSTVTSKYEIYPSYQIDKNKYRYVNSRYAKGVGIVTEIMPFFLQDPNYTERRLVRYHIQN